ncbi:MAG TPA: ABC transporter permease [Vicinamibacterales bacterium]|jgi:putative ABC transport system permease protein
MTARELLARIAGAFGAGRRRDADLRRELAFHAAMLETRHREGGRDAESARRAARLELGGSAQIAEAWRDQRGLPGLDTLRQDIRDGLRALRRAPGFTVAALATLAIGIGANTAIFTVVDAVLLRPLPYVEPDRLVTVGDRTAAGFSSNVGFATVADWRQRSRSFESLALMRGWGPTLVVDGEAELVPAARVSWNYFDMLGVRPALGRGFTADDDRSASWQVLLLSDRLWRRRFNADPAVVGRTIVMNDRAFRIVGVMPAAYEPLAEQRYERLSAELWAPLGYDLSGPSSCRSCQHLRGFARLKPNTTAAAAAEEMQVIREQMRREHPADYETGTIAVIPLARALTGQVQAALYVLLGAVAFVLLIACANVASLQLARSVARRRELALRAALGAGRTRIVRLLLTESVLLSAGGAIAGVALAASAIHGLAALAPVSLPRLDHVSVDARVLAFTALVAMATGVVFGLVPALHAGRADPRATLVIDSRGSVGVRSRARSTLVVVDLALALVLLAGAGLMLRTVDALTRVTPGFDARQLLSFQFSLGGKAYATNEQVVAYEQRTLEALAALPGVERVALAGQIPFGGNYDCSALHVKGRMKPNAADDPCIERYGVTPGYLQTMGIPLRGGRDFTGDDRAAAPAVLIVSESTARLIWGHDSPIGSQVRIGNAERGPWITVVGVAGDVNHADLTEPPRAAMYNPQAQRPDASVAVLKTATADATAVAAAARRVVRDIDPSVPVYQVASLASLIGESGAQRRFVTRLLAGFAAVAVLLAALGLYGVVSYGVAQRTREVGVRIALGAQRGDVSRLVLRSGVPLVAAGLAAGTAAALVTTRYLGSLLYGVSPVDPATLLSSAVLLAGVALLAHWIPMRRALRIDPVRALQAD